MGDNGVRKGGFRPSTTLPYDIRYPPSLPDKIQFKHKDTGHEMDIDSNWSVHAKYIGLRDDLWGQGFETRLFNCNDPSLKGKHKPDDWDVQYRLGSPSEERLNWNNLVTKWGLQVLDKAGFLNLDMGLPDGLLAPRGRYFDKRSWGWQSDPIHPVFRKEMWKNIDDTEIPWFEYYNLEPALTLATAMLEDPTTMCLFHAMVTPSCHVYFKDTVVGWCTKLQVPDSLTEAEQESIHEKICDMRQYTHFYWTTTEELEKYGALAFTTPLPRTASAFRIAMSRLYPQALYNWKENDKKGHYSTFFKNILIDAQVPPSHRPEGFAEDLDSAPLRTCFLFAGLLLHEFGHAFRHAYFPRAHAPFEPWVGDSRDNEFGHAVVKHIFGGIPYANYYVPSRSTTWERRWQLKAYAPFGICFVEKYDQWAEAGKQHIVKGMADDFKAPNVQFPLPARQLDDYFTQDLWKKEVPRYGLDAIKFVKIPEWASYRMPGPDRLKPEEQSTLR
ncbi:hypothetical protein E4T44_03545 [Aureobasidium sp. EXF-8845]|nr:hypothetical protein E4T44_03545 [Aureobasidium sp. EXF-8845]